MNRLAKLFRDSFSIDLKMLGLFRFLVGLIVLWDLWGRFQIRRLVFGEIVPPDLSADGHSIWHISLFWVDRVFGGLAGSFSGALGQENGFVQFLFSAETYFQSPAWIDLVFYIGIGAAVLYCLGLYSRFAAFFLWLVLLSVQHCMPMMNTGGDSLLKMFAFWSVFLPVGCCFSLDRILFPRNGYWRKRVSQVEDRLRHWCQDRGLGSPPVSQHLCTAATAAIMLQLVAVYFFSGLEKCNGDWFSGNALGVALSCPNYVKPLGDWLAGQSWVTMPMTWCVLIVELSLPFLVFVPGLFRYTRRPVILFLVLMHLGIAMTMSIGTFWMVSIVGWLLFLPSNLGSNSSTAWGFRLLGVLGRPDKKIVQADDLYLESEKKESTKRKFMADAVVVEYDHQEDVKSDIARGSVFLDPGAGKWSTASDYYAAMMICMILWWQLSFVPSSVVGERVHGSFPGPLRPAIYFLSADDLFPLFAYPPEGKVQWHYDLDSLGSEKMGPVIPLRPGSLMESHSKFLWRQYHFNLSFRSTYSDQFVRRLKLQFKNWAEETHVERRGGVKSTKPESKSQQ